MNVQPCATATSLIDLVEHWASVTPHRSALRYGGRHWTWAEWSQRIRRLSGLLVDAGVGPGDRVGFLDMNHPACLEVTVAAASIGAAAVIFNWRMAPDELTYALNDSQARTLFVGAERLPTLAAATILERIDRLVVVGGNVDEYEGMLANAHSVAPGKVSRGSDPALIIYSSGTTGRPKGVVLSQNALLAHIRNVGPVFPFDVGDSNLVAMPLFHVGGICYAFLGVAAGVPTILVRQPDVATLIDAVAAGATHAFLVPAVIINCLASDRAVEAIGALRYLGYGAAPAPLPLLKQALAIWQKVRFVQFYGQTELSGVATVLGPDEHRDAEHSHLLLSAGRPVPGVEILVAEPDTGDQQPSGSIGELWFRTDQAMMGYLNHPEATAATVTSMGWVRTGDLGRMDDDGYVYVEDRLKDMIITGGENVYCPEVERALLNHSAIADAAVIGVPDSRWGEAVKAIVVTTSLVTSDDVIAFCRAHLAAYKCPSTVDIVDVLPRNPSGKILKHQLREPYWVGRDRQI
ncbi:long-chain fatty acid--CoA ligase [Mycobacteroides chelonae]|uniref:AMP-binding protein n=1 Tax=Mycobacteroides chelonae TaxID=1774 RepID=UPI0008A9A963|nr:AMP-binding protein [Mycobacteroides chelonae]OHU55721.1 long-chain fatty acid--CoA ligase [Mycobacteroides chelonae]PKQ58169.1 long-chain fatty acid--CoA ligase [Mycobacterium sp. MHSD3]